MCPEDRLNKTYYEIPTSDSQKFLQRFATSCKTLRAPPRDVYIAQKVAALPRATQTTESATLFATAHRVFACRKVDLLVPVFIWNAVVVQSPSVLNVGTAVSSLHYPQLKTLPILLQLAV